MKVFPVRSRKTDKYMDYVYKSYAPAGPAAGKYASENFFIVSAGRDARLLDFADRLKEKLGRNRIVYGVKKKNGKMYWELYFPIF